MDFNQLLGIIFLLVGILLLVLFYKDVRDKDYHYSVYSLNMDLTTSIICILLGVLTLMDKINW